MLNLFKISKKVRYLFCASALFCAQLLADASPASPAPAATSAAPWIATGNKIAQFGETFGEGLLGGFGYCAPRFKYSAQLWNDLPVPASAVIRPSTNYMGAKSELIAQMYAPLFGKMSVTPSTIYQEMVRPYSIEAYDSSGNPANLLDKHMCSGRFFVDLAALPKTGFQREGAGELFAGLTVAATLLSAAEMGAAGGSILSAAGGAAGGGFMGFSMMLGGLSFLAPFEGLIEDHQKKHFYTYPSRDTSFDVAESDKDTIHHFHTYALHGQPGCENIGNDDLEGGPYAPTPAFDGAFFNHTQQEVKLKFTKKSGIYEKSYNPNSTGGTYTITLEPESFNLLSSGDDEPEAIRSAQELRSFDFTLGSKTIQIPTGVLVKVEGKETLVPKIGLGQEYTVKKDPKRPETEKKIDPLTYTYEITGALTDGKPENFFVGVQGFNMGHYNPIGMLLESEPKPDSPFIADLEKIFEDLKKIVEKLTKALEDKADDTSLRREREENLARLKEFLRQLEADRKLAKIRDINPIDCFIWCQSIDQYNAENVKAAVDKATIEQTLKTRERMWAIYKTRDVTVQKKLNAGEVTAFSIIRPQVNEGTAFLFIFAVDADSDDQAKSFLSDASDHVRDLFASISQAQETTDAKNTIPQKTSYVSFTDTHGTTGYLLLVDMFRPYGGGYSGPRWYKVPPMIHEVGNEGLADSIAMLCLDDTKTGDARVKDYEQKQRSITANLGGWFEEFNKSKSALDAAKITVVNATDPSRVAALGAAVPSLTNYLKTNGASMLFTDKTQKLAGAGREFSDFGINQLYQIILGPIGFANPLIRRQAGSNEYLWNITWPEAGIWGELKTMPQELKQFLPKKEEGKK